ncbi:hypothetical protein R9C00_17495 [Flammeovirgaceae bacterium SG7u.111]|nr:hypothetical protein [Flammeovirgaceae bacterium SG7u.132]WPO33498.1 hypothetical protein R9C00_17495 [Flammeovirgaceae bacterium SG7u.111]
MNKILNLNNLKIQTDSGSIDLLDNNVIMESPDFSKVEVYFRELEANLIEKIKEFKNGLVFGSVAWLTSFNILDALAQCENVQIVVQKEDFLRPDLNIQYKSDWKIRLRNKYDKLKFVHDRYDISY